MHADPAELNADRATTTAIRSTWSTATIPSSTCSSCSGPRQRRADEDAVQAKAHHLLDRGRVDQKSCCVSDPQFTQKYFSAEDRQVFRRHILWTRLGVSERRTLLPDGQFGDLLPYVRREHEHLVQTNIAAAPSSATWPRTVETARWTRPRPGTLGGLELASISKFHAYGKVHFEQVLGVMGFAPTKYGLSVARPRRSKSSTSPSAGGGVVIGRPGQLVAPSPKPQGEVLNPGDVSKQHLFHKSDEVATPTDPNSNAPWFRQVSAK